jgi:hypothetical protein
VEAGGTPVLVHNCNGGGAIDLGNLKDRADSLHDLLPNNPRARNGATTGLMHVEGDGSESLDIVAVGARKNISGIQRAQLLPDELGVSVTTKDATGEFKHAEVKMWEAAEHMELTPTGLAVSRPICPACQEFLTGKGATILGDFHAIWE